MRRIVREGQKVEVVELSFYRLRRETIYGARVLYYNMENR